jgi:hypothetical protein
VGQAARKCCSHEVALWLASEERSGSGCWFARSSSSYAVGASSTSMAVSVDTVAAGVAWAVPAEHEASVSGSAVERLAMRVVFVVVAVSQPFVLASFVGNE